MTNPTDITDRLDAIGFTTETRPHHMGGTAITAAATDGWQLSIVRFAHSYGADEGLWEVAVINGGLRYDTPLTSDVIGHCDAAKVETIGKALLAWIAQGAQLVAPDDDRDYDTEDDLDRLANAFTVLSDPRAWA